LAARKIPERAFTQKVHFVAQQFEEICKCNSSKRS